MPEFTLDFLDIRKAHLNGASKICIAIHLPKEAGGGYESLTELCMVRAIRQRLGKSVFTKCFQVLDSNVDEAVLVYIIAGRGISEFWCMATIS